MPGVLGSLGLVVWGTLAGLDLVSLLQGLLSRPLVVGAVAGLFVGDVESGLRIGALLELFALDVVPVGASRYPDFGAATVAAVAYGANGSWPATLGASVGLGLGLAILFGTTIPAVRRLNARTVRAYGDQLARGDGRAVTVVHLTCLGHDAVRSLLISGLGVGLGLALAGFHPPPALGQRLTQAAVVGAAWALAHGAVASGRSGARWRWTAVGAVLGFGWSVL